MPGIFLSIEQRNFPKRIFYNLDIATQRHRMYLKTDRKKRNQEKQENFAGRGESGHKCFRILDTVLTGTKL